MTPEPSSTVMGDAAIALHRAAYALDAIRDRLDALGVGIFDTEQRVRPYAALEQFGGEMDALTEELTAKLSAEDDAVVAFAGARAAVGDIVVRLAVLRDSDRRTFDMKKAADDAMEEMEGLRSGFDECRERFMKIARASAGER